MDITLSRRFPKDYAQINLIPSFPKPRSASNPKTKLPALHESVHLKSRQKRRTSTAELKVQINNQSSNWTEIRTIGQPILARSYHSTAVVKN